MRTFWRIIAVLTPTFLPLIAAAQGTFDRSGNLVRDGSFESLGFNPTGSLSPWRWSGCLSLAVNERASDGHNFAIVCGLMYQDIGTIPGLPYQLRFAFGGNEQQQQNLEPLHVTWGNQEVAAIPMTPVPALVPQWRYFTFEVVAAESTTRLGFTSYPGQAWPYIDEVSVVFVPEPSVFSFLAIVTVGHFISAVSRRRRRAPPQQPAAL